VSQNIIVEKENVNETMTKRCFNDITSHSFTFFSQSSTNMPRGSTSSR
jgi:hypothetical protein